MIGGSSRGAGLSAAVRGRQPAHGRLHRDRDALYQRPEMVHAYFPILRERAAGCRPARQQQQDAADLRRSWPSPARSCSTTCSTCRPAAPEGNCSSCASTVNGTTILLVEQTPTWRSMPPTMAMCSNGRTVMEDRCDRLREKEDIKEFYPRHEGGGRALIAWKRRRRR